MVPLLLGRLRRLSYVLTFPCFPSWSPSLPTQLASIIPPLLPDPQLSQALLLLLLLLLFLNPHLSQMLLLILNSCPPLSLSAPHLSLVTNIFTSSVAQNFSTKHLSSQPFSASFKRSEPFSTSTFFHPPLECDHLRPPSIRSSFTHKAPLLFCLVTIATIFTNSLRPTAFVRTPVMEHFQRSV